MSQEKKSLNNFSAGLGQADVTQPGSFKSAEVHISLTNPSVWAFGVSPNALDMVYGEWDFLCLTLGLSVAELLIHHAHTGKLKDQGVPIGPVFHL